MKTIITYGTFSMLLDALDLSAKRYPNIELLNRQASLLITDYSSCAIDFMLTGRPTISFAYDFEHYAGTERGLFYDLEHVFPGPVCRDFAQLATTLSAFVQRYFDSVSRALSRIVGPAAGGPAAERPARRRAWQQRLFFDHADDGSAARVAARVRQLVDRRGEVSPGQERKA